MNGQTKLKLTLNVIYTFLDESGKREGGHTPRCSSTVLHNSFRTTRKLELVFSPPPTGPVEVHFLFNIHDDREPLISVQVRSV